MNAPIATNPAELKPVWLRIKDAIRVSGLCRSTLYNLIADGKIKSFSNKIHRDCQRGTRLISYDSLMAHLEAAYQESQQDA